jgi:hypothetical protein
MQWWMSRWRPLAYGGVTLGILQAAGGIDWNQVWFQFWYLILNVFITLLFGGDTSAISSEAISSPFGSLFL